MNKLFTKLVGAFLGLAMVASVGTAIGVENFRNRVLEVEGASGDNYVFTSTEGTSTDGNWSYIAEKNTGSNDPVMNSGKLRIYPGNRVTFTAKSGYEFVSASFAGIAINGGGSKKDKFPSGWNVDHGAITTFSTTLESCAVTNIAESEFTITIEGSAGNVNFGSVTIIYQTGVHKYTVTYTADEHGTGTFTDSQNPEGEYQLLDYSETQIKANDGYRFKNYLVNSESKQPGDIINLNADLNVIAVFEELSGSVTFQFSEVISKWDGSYSEHVVEYPQGNVTFASANKNNQTITDIPVTKGGDVSFVLNDTANSYISGYSFVCRQWGTKGQTITGHYSKDAGNTYTSTGITSTNFALSVSDLGKGTNAIKISFSSTSNQVGIESLTLYIVKEGKTPTICITRPTSHFAINQEGLFDATTENATNPRIEWSSSDDEILLVDTDGSYLGTSYGAVTITASMTCDESSTPIVDTCEAIVDAGSITIKEANEIASSLSSGETTVFNVNIEGLITNLDTDTKKRAVTLSSDSDDSIMVFGVYENNPIREYAIINGTASFEGKLKNYNGTNELVSPVIVSYTDDAIEYSGLLNESLASKFAACSITEEDWETAESMFDDLDEYAKARLQEATTSDVKTEIATWIGHYDLIVSKLGYKNFMARTSTSANRYNVLTNIDGENPFAIVVIISLIGFTTVGAFFYIRKRKQHN